MLIDAGLGKRETLRRLAAVEKRVDRLDGILISHEHADHIGGLPQVLAQWRTAVYLTEPTHEEARRLLPEGSAKRINRVQYIRAGQRFPIGDIEVAAFSIPPEAADPVGFTFPANAAKGRRGTDLGVLPDLCKHHLPNPDCLILESNHD